MTTPPSRPPGSSPGTRSRRGGSGLSSLLMPELQRIAQSMGIPGAGRMRKGQLVEAIEARQGARPSTRQAKQKPVSNVLDPRVDLSGKKGVQKVLDYLYSIDQDFVIDSIRALRRGARELLGHSIRGADLFGPEGFQKIGDQWDVLGNYAEIALPESNLNRAVIDASYDPVWREALGRWVKENIDLLGEDELGGMPAFEHAANLDLESYAKDFADPSPALQSALEAGRLPCAPTLVRQSRRLAMLSASIWRVTSADSPLFNRLLDIDELPVEREEPRHESLPAPVKGSTFSSSTRPRSRPQIEGARLEVSMLDIFRRLFSFDSNEIQRLQMELRRQQSGTQFGADIIFRRRPQILIRHASWSVRTILPVLGQDCRYL